MNAPLPMFDRALKISEKHLRELLPWFRDAKLFSFPAKTYKVLSEVPLDEVALALENFFLPFPTVAVEDNATCTLIMDTVENQVGFDDYRMFVDICPLYSKSEGMFNDTDDVRDAMQAMQEDFRARGIPKETCLISVGRFKGVHVHEGKIGIEGSVGGLFTVCKSGHLVPPQTDVKDAPVVGAALRHAKTAIEEIVYFNSPSRFICKKERNAKVKTKRGSVPRSNARPLYTALRPKEIHKFTGERTGETSGKSDRQPHWRRRHQRLLTSDRYAKLKGKTITVKASWVGAQDFEMDGHYWKVMLDL